MTSRNVIKLDIPDSYYHVYARGASRQPIFIDKFDFNYFLMLFQRYLARKEFYSKVGISYAKLYDEVELLAYCLLKNHFHILLYQINQGAMSRLMRGVMTAYSQYFNKKYHRSGGLFESRYKASRISSDEYLLHISRYIHLNPNDWQNYPYSSMAIYNGDIQADWVKSERIIRLFSSRQQYREFVAGDKDRHDELEQIKHELADY